MKAFAARATLVILPLVVFSTPSFAAQGLPAVKEKQEIRVSSQDQSLEKVAHHHRHNGCCQASSSVRNDDDMTDQLPATATRELKSLYQE